jgi:anaerobic ribonucleoside-triphosphate reductase activating protein
MDTWAARPADATVEGLLGGLAEVAAKADGLTVTGGEPFDQPDALLALLDGWRQMARGDVIVFSGYPVETIAPTLERCSGWIDLLVADPFVVSAGHTKPLRGSDNQRLLGLTRRGRRLASLYRRSIEPADRVLDILFDDHTGEVFMAGIPQPGDMRRLAEALTGQGHVAAVSEGRRRSAAC